jgi:hypothetical protein
MLNIDLMTVTTFSEMKVSLDAWKHGKDIVTFNIEADHEEKRIDYSAKPLLWSLKKRFTTLCNI